MPTLTTECWMVASGVGPELALLSPRAWPTDACEHDPVEGVATLASRQMAAEHAGDARAAIAAGKVPEHLADFWSGRYRYAVSGSLVEFVDTTWGRPVLVRLLGVTPPRDALALLGTTEPELIALGGVG